MPSFIDNRARLIQFLKTCPDRKASRGEICKGLNWSPSKVYSMLKELEHDADFHMHNRGIKFIG